MDQKAAYQEDLAYIHDVGFHHIAESAAPVVLEALKRDGIDRGTIVDLGCGSGITSRLFCDAGFDVVGFDLSEAMIEMARERVPEAEFQVCSFVTAAMPPCNAVTAIGEVLGYAFDPSNSLDALEEVLRRIHAALASDGVLVFDMAGQDRVPSGNPHRTFVENADWAVLVEVEANDRRTLLTRRITTFRKQGERYRRSHEVHRLLLIDPAKVVVLLQRIGFSVETFDRYGARSFPQGVAGFKARKSAK